MERHITLEKIEAIAGLGSYETDLTNGTWRIFGLPPKDRYTVEEFQALIHPDDFSKVMAYFSECLKNKKNFDYEYRCVNSLKETIYVSSRSEIIYAPDGTPLKVYGTKQDITERKLAELKLSESYEINERKNAVLKLVAHDLRTPITQIQMLNELMMGNADGVSREYLNLKNDICSHSETIIAELIEMAELDSDKQRLALEPFDINEIIRNSLQIFSI